MLNDAKMIRPTLLVSNLECMELWWSNFGNIWWIVETLYGICSIWRRSTVLVGSKHKGYLPGDPDVFGNQLSHLELQYAEWWNRPTSSWSWPDSWRGTSVGEVYWGHKIWITIAALNIYSCSLGFLLITSYHMLDCAGHESARTINSRTCPWLILMMDSNQFSKLIGQDRSMQLSPLVIPLPRPLRLVGRAASIPRKLWRPAWTWGALKDKQSICSSWTS